MKPIVYLAGPISGLTWEEATKWRQDVAAQLGDLGITVRDPFRGKDFIKRKIKRQGGFDTEALAVHKKGEHPLVSGHGIVMRDLWDVASCDMLLVNFLGADRVSIGTVVEIATARAKGKYILVVMEDGNPHQHPFITELASMVLDDWDEALSLVPVILGV